MEIKQGLNFRRYTYDEKYTIKSALVDCNRVYHESDPDKENISNML